jgi:streptomycin 6-kinase
MNIPDEFALRMIEVYGDVGAAWLEHLPQLIAECEQRWALTVQPPFALTYNYVAPAVRVDGTPVVIKLGVPGSVIQTELAALQLYDGKGIVQLLEADADQAALLLERLLPGTPLTQLALQDDAQATAIAAEVMRQLWRPAPADHPFPTVQKWSQGMQRLRTHFDGGTGPLPKRLVELAETLFADLLASMAEPVLLHGDLHHDNILSAHRQPWLALDPQGVVGEPAYEVGALLRNPMPQLLSWPDLKRVQARRVDQLAEVLGFDRERIVAWGVAQAVLSGWWSIEDHGAGWEPAFACAGVLAELL